MKLIKRFIAVLILICIIFSLCACGGGSERIYVALDNMPATLDPQLAKSDSELLVARNIYEGLLRQKENGEIVPAAAERYDYSALTYTFTLRDNLCWADGEPVLAEDFVFGIKRALSPETDAPFARLLYAIVGAREAHTGIVSNDSIGIYATDEKTVIIKLDYEDKDFLRALSMPVSMPCRQEFFDESIGKYGLSKECVLSNGPYYLARWNKAENGIRLYVNEKYNGKAHPKNGGVFIAKDKQKTVAEKLISGEADIAFLDSESLLDIKENGKIKTASVQNICWVLSLGGELSKNIRQALCMCYSSDVYSKEMSSSFRVANSFFPNALGVSEPSSSWAISYDSVTPQSLISDEIKNLKNKKFPQTTLIYGESEALKPAIIDVVGNWQEKLSAFINIKPTDKLLESELKEHSASLSVFPVKADSTLGEYISKFGIEYSGDIVAAYAKMLGEYNLLPFAFEDTTVGYLENISGVYMNAVGGYIDFSCIVKK